MSRIALLLPSDKFAPPLATTLASPPTTASRTSAVSVAARLVSSVINGSTRGWCSMSTPSAAEPRLLTEEEASESDLTNVRCNWGKKGFTNWGTRVRRIVRVERIADLTGAGKRSPMTRTERGSVGAETASERTEGSHGLDAVSLEGLGRRSLDEVTERVRGLLSLLACSRKQTLQQDSWNRVSVAQRKASGTYAGSA